MQSYNWSQFTLRIPIKADREIIYRNWTAREGLEYWFLRKAEFKKPDGSLRENNEAVQVGDTYEWMWHGWSDEVMEKGKVLEMNGTDYFKFSFGKAGDVTIKLVQEDGEKIVELTQDNIPNDEEGKITWHIGCTKGWNFYLTNLKSLLEGGIDLRNRNEKLKDVINS
jgi:uncharacterized protein YndB with AHSA1/START domain